MDILKRYSITLTVSFFPLILLAQTAQFKYELLPLPKHTFQYEQLPQEKDKEAQFLENYSKGVEHYNKAVNIIKTEGDFTEDELVAVTNKAMDEIKLALPYFENAYKLNPKDKNTLEGLSGIHFTLNQLEKSKKYKEELDALRGK